MQPTAKGVSQSVYCLLNTTVSCAKMAEQIEIPIDGVWCVGPRNHVLDRKRHL